MNIFEDVLVHALKVARTDAERVKLSRAMDAAIIFGAMQQRLGQGDFEKIDHAQLQALYDDKVRQLRLT